MFYLTNFLAIFLGLYCALMATTLLLRGRESALVIAGLLDEPGVVLLAGAIALAAGLAMVLGHDRWRGLLPIVVTLLGWVILLKGVALLVLPSSCLRRLYGALQYERFFGLYMGVMLLAGLVLVLAGFCD